MGRNRAVVLRFYVDEHELGLITDKMRQSGFRNRDAYLRKMAVDGYCVKLDLPEIRKLTSLMRYSSNNLNQYAKKANESGRVDPRDIEELQKRFNETYDLENEILESLARIG